jgi:nucleoside-diphosphate-sugar epimerase
MVPFHDILIFGGAANTGLKLVLHARARGLRVACMVRPQRDSSQLQRLGVTVLPGDALHAADCQAAMHAAQPAAVISLLGGKNADGQRVDASGNIHAIDAAVAWQEQLRFLLVTSIGCDEQADWLSPQARALLGPALQEKTRAEHYLRASRLRWSIVRPAGLSHAQGCGRYQLIGQRPAAALGGLSRSDAALAVLDGLNERRVGQVLTVIADAAWQLPVGMSA